MFVENKLWTILFIMHYLLYYEHREIETKKYRNN